MPTLPAPKPLRKSGSSTAVKGRCAGNVVYAVWHELSLWRGGDVLCGEIAIFFIRKQKNVICTNLGDRVGLSPGTEKNNGKL